MADEVLHTEDNHCQPILVNGKLMPIVPEYMPSFPVALKGIKHHFVCKLAESTTTQHATTKYTTESTTSHPTTTTQSTSTQDTTAMSSTEATTTHPTTTPQSTTTQDTTTMSTTESTTSHPTTTTQTTTTQDTTSMSTTDSTTSRPTTTTPSTAKIFVTDKGTEYKIFVADLQADLDFTSIPSTKEPLYITYDSVEKKIYWTDFDEQRVYRSDADGGNREEVTSENDKGIRGIAIAESSRILYIAYRESQEITTVDIGQGSAFPGSETNFVTTYNDFPWHLEVDEEQGFLYWSMKKHIQRKSLNGSGSTETVYNNDNLSKITGLSIDLSRDPRRIFFCDFEEQKTFYKDVNQSLTMDPHGLAVAHELTSYMNDPGISGGEERKNLRDIKYFNGNLYWTKEGSPKGIAVMTNYDQSSRSFAIKETSVISKPFRFIITTVDP
eukprot:XP_011678389.1 PREDICTED: hyphal wall protein 1-like [Strongylocentrotus purpuratus]